VIVKPRKIRRPRPPRGCRAIEKKKYCYWLAGVDVFVTKGMIHSKDFPTVHKIVFRTYLIIEVSTTFRIAFMRKLKAY
jgi:hypothetical protein